MERVSKYKFGEFEADVRAGELRRKGQRLKLQLQPFYVLVALLERPKDVVTREELRQRIWPEDTFVDFDHSLNTAVAKVRDALGDSAGSPKYVETIAKRGYRFLGEVEAVGEAAQAALATQAKPSPTAAASVAAQSSATQGQPAQPASALHANANATSQPLAADSGVHPELPRASRSTTRFLFMLAQLMYVVFYIAALFRWERLAQATETAWRGAGTTAFVVYMVTALAGLAVRLYLITATAFDYHLLGEKYRRIFPALFVLDMIWALSPLLLKDRIGMGLALGACAALIYMPFAQRVLMKMMQPTS